ncbi:hypothetical protein BCR33DRAFT_295632 [Rhizoclosmatium globosum]|uniref:Uncharacterized protein n=1 Tax=Rhizoclosmatium globosum TaxID=329046 RepID=A0A1Y2C604_9FUNG|nr:hypothetical protein BCR33DRAFT_295632 [Rhizoclosmatium globosum]|eukprot:ORY42470.1 hypothetical protein BCR33DRAFT_295632 [Rhizoclosmatium globosum]
MPFTNSKTLTFSGSNSGLKSLYRELNETFPWELPSTTRHYLDSDAYAQMMKNYEPSLEKSDDRVTILFHRLCIKKLQLNEKVARTFSFPGSIECRQEQGSVKVTSSRGLESRLQQLLQYSTLEFIVIPVYIRGADSLLLYNYESKRFEWITLANKNVVLAIQALQEKKIVPGEIEIVDVSKLQTLLDTYSA